MPAPAPAPAPSPASASPSASAASETELPAQCPLCDTPLGEDRTQCTRCDWVRGYRQQQKWQLETDPRDVAAAVLSVIPGAGHFFKGHRTHAIAFFAGMPVIFVLAFTFTMFLGWLMVPSYWIAVAADAYFRTPTDKALTNHIQKPEKKKKRTAK